MASASILVRSRQGPAMSGVQTMGSFSVKLVLSTTGTPVSCLKALIKPQSRGLTCCSTVCKRPVPSIGVTAGCLYSLHIQRIEDGFLDQQHKLGEIVPIF